MIDYEYPMTPTAALRALVRNPNSQVGLLLREHLVIDQRVLYSFLPPLSDLAVTDHTHSEIIEISDNEARS